MKENKGQGVVADVDPTSGGTYKAEKFEEDADKVVEYYRDQRLHQRARRPAGVEDPRGLARTARRAGSSCGSRSPKGKRYKVGDVNFEGNTIVKAEGLRPLFKLRRGGVLQREGDPEGLREGQGAVRQRRLHGVHRLSRSRAARCAGRRRGRSAAAGPPAASGAPPAGGPSTGPPIVNVTLRIQEGKQYFVNRITFVGNTTTRDNVIRREVRLVESGVFNTEALKFSVKRLNQLGYFKPLEGEAIDGREDARRRQQGRRQVEVRRAEPEPAHVRRRRVAVRRVLRAAVVPDVELPRPRRDLHDIGAAGQPRDELPARVHRAVPVRPAADRRRRPVHPRDCSTSGSTRRSRRAATSSTVSRSPTLRGCS